MWWFVWALSAHASPERPFARADDSLSVQRYAAVRGEGPVQARWRRRGGPIEAWTWSDGVVQRYRTYQSGRIEEEHTYDAAGHPDLVIRFADDRPAEVTLPKRSPIDVSDWVPVDGLGARWLAPQVSVEDPDRLEWSLPDVGDARAQLLEGPVDPFADAFERGLLAGCSCAIIDRSTAWIDSQPAVRYLVERPTPTEPELSEIWAWPVAEHLLVFAFTTPGGDGAGDRLAVGRAMVGLLATEPS